MRARSFYRGFRSRVPSGWVAWLLLLVGLWFVQGMALEVELWKDFSSRENIRLNAVTATRDSMFYFVGSFLPSGETSTRGLLLKTDYNFREVFAKPILPENGALVLTDVLPLPGGGVAVLGTEYRTEGMRALLLFFSDSGEEEQRSYLEMDENVVTYRFVRQQDGIFLVAGYIMGSRIESKDGAVLAVDGSGKIKWVRKTRESGEDALTDILLAPDGTIYAAGYVHDAATGGDNGLFVALTPRGKLSNKKVFSENLPLRYVSLAFLNENALTLAGYQDKKGIWKKEALVQGLKRDAGISWEKSTHLPGDQEFRRVIPSWRNSYFAVGVKEKRTQKKRAVFLWEISESGAKLESKTVSLPFSAEAKDVLQLGNGDVVVCGFVETGSGSRGLAIRLIDRNPLPEFQSARLTVRYSGTTGASKILLTEDGQVQFAISNPARFPMREVWLQITVADSTLRTMYDTTLTGIYLNASGDYHGSVPVKLMEQPISKMALITARLWYKGQYLLTEKKLQLPFELPPPPRFALRAVQFLKGDNSRSILQKVPVGEKALIQLTVENTSEYWAGGVRVRWTPKSSLVEIIGLSARTVGNVPPGGTFDVTFAFSLNPSVGGEGEIPFELEVQEATRETRSVLYGKIPFHKPENAPVVAAKNETPAEENFPDPDIDVENEIEMGHIYRDNAFAVIIGNKNYRGNGNIPEVTYAHRDARLMAEYFEKVLGLKKGNIFLLLDATKADFDRFFGIAGNPKGKLYNLVKSRNSDVFIYYAGHGAPDTRTNNAYFVPVDCDPNYVENTGYPLDLFYSNLANLPARNLIVFIDACFSGSGVLKNISPLIVVSRATDVLNNRKNVAVFTSSKGSQVSAWYPEKKHSLFTYFVAKGLSQFRADLDGDGKITVEELFQFVSNDSEGVPYYARYLHNVEQTPVLLGKNTDYVLTKWK